MRITENDSYKAIWGAVILQTLADLRPRTFTQGEPKIKDTGDPRKNAKQIEKAYRKREEVRLDYIANRAYARRWLDSKSRKPASFLWICEHLDIDPEPIRAISRDHERIEMLLTGKLKGEL